MDAKNQRGKGKRKESKRPNHCWDRLTRVKSEGKKKEVDPSRNSSLSGEPDVGDFGGKANREKKFGFHRSEKKKGEKGDPAHLNERSNWENREGPWERICSTHAALHS